MKGTVCADELKLVETRTATVWFWVYLSPKYFQKEHKSELAWHVVSSFVMAVFSPHWCWSSEKCSLSLTVSRAESIAERKQLWLAFYSGKWSVGSTGGSDWDLTAFPDQLVCARMCVLPKGGRQCVLSTVGSSGVCIHLGSLLLASTPTNQSPLHWSAQQT